MQTQYHECVRRITDLLTANNCAFRTFEHEPVRTSQEAASVRPGLSIEQGAKALLLISTVANTQTPVLFVIPAHTKLNTKKAKTVLNTRDLRFATPEEVSSITGGVQVGGVPPFGSVFGIKVYVDPQLYTNAEIVFNAGDRRFSVAMFSTDYRRVEHPIEVSLID